MLATLVPREVDILGGKVHRWWAPLDGCHFFFSKVRLLSDEVTFRAKVDKFHSF